MKTSRVIVTVVVLVAFTVGLNLGLFLGGGSAATGGAPQSGSGAGDTSSADGTAGSSSRGPRRMIDRVPVGQDGGGLTGDELVSRAWTALTNPDDNARLAAWLGLLGSITSREAPAIRELFRKRLADGYDYYHEWSTFWPQWGEVEGSAAMEHVEKSETGDVQAELAGRVMQGWAKSDAAAARAWLEAHVSSPLFDSALKGYVKGLARVDLTAATQAALTFSQGRSKADLANVLIEQAVQQRQLGGMLDWWRALPDQPGNDSTLRTVALAPVVERLTRVNLAQAQAFVGELASTPLRSDDLIGDIAGRLASKNPADAVAWVASLPPSPNDGHYNGIGRSVKAWMAKEPAAVDAWIAALPPSPLRDQAVEAKSPPQVTDTVGFTTIFNAKARTLLIDSGNTISIDASKSEGSMDKSLRYFLTPNAENR
jgi:hypothetical protein